MTDHKLPCPVVRDLLPSYIEGLTEAETSAAVAAHLEGCPDCKARYEAMRAPAQAEQPPAAPEVDYLKTVRRRNHLKILGAVAGVLLAVIAGVALKLFVIGSPVGPEGTAIFTAPVENGLELQVASISSANAFTGWNIREDEDTITITARSVLVSPWNRDGTATLSIPLRPEIREVRVFGETVWQDGLSISVRTQNLMRYKTPYVGDASAVNALISQLDLDYAHTLELHTDAEPYGLTIHMGKVIDPSRYFIMEQAAYELLALVDNLSVVRWDDPSGAAMEYTLEAMNAALPALVEQYNAAHGTDWTAPASIKDWGSDPFHFQQLESITEPD